MLFRLLLVAFESLWRSRQFSQLRHHQRTEKVWIQITDRAAHPDIKKVAKPGIADVVVIGWIGAYQQITNAIVATRGIKLMCFTEPGGTSCEHLNTVGDVLAARTPT